MKFNQQVIYLSYDGLTDPLGQSQVLPYLLGLSANYRIHIISFEKKLNFERDNAQITKLISGSNIDWHPLLYHKSPPVLSTLWDVYKMNSEVKKIISKNNIQLIHCRSYISALIGLSWKKKKNIKFLFDMRGFWADERVEGNIWRLNNFIYKTVYRFFKKKESLFFSEADHLVSLTDAGKDIIHKMYPNTTITTIPCCVDDTLFNKNKSDLSKQDLGITANAQVLLYLGSIGTWYMLDEMLQFFKIYLQQFPESVFLFVTRDEKEPILEAGKKYNISPDRIIIRSASRKEVSSYLSLASFGVFFIRPTFSKKASSPTKLAELLSVGIPVITNAGVGDVEQIINEFNVGYVLKDLTEKGMQILTTEIKNNKKVFDPERLRKIAIQEFSLNIGVERYKKVYQSLL